MLTNTQAREAKPRSTRYEITCDSLPGFILRVLPTGKRVFFARYRDAAGKDHRHRLGLMGPDFGADEARREAMAILAHRDADASAGEPAPAPTTAATAPTIGPKSPKIREFACRFEQEHIDMYLKPRTAQKYRSTLRLYILPALGDRRFDEVSTADVQRLHNSLKAMPCAANYVRCVLSVMFSKAEHWELTTCRNPVTVVKRFKERAVERFLNPDERQALERTLAQSNLRIADLEGRLSSTDDSVNQSSAAMQVKLKEVAGEVDKLWASAWRKNGARIDELEAALKKTSATADADHKQLGEIAAAQTKLQQRVASGEEIAAQLKTLKEQQGSLQSAIGRLNSTMNTLTSTQSAQESRLKEGEQWVQSNVEFRRQVNQRLTRLENPPSALQP